MESGETEGMVEERLQKLLNDANKLKDEANQAFKACRFQQAITLYTEAVGTLVQHGLGCKSEDEAVINLKPQPNRRCISPGEPALQQNGERETVFSGGAPSAAALRETLAVLFANRAVAHLKLEAHGFAIRDASHAITLATQVSSKAHYRRGAAYFALGKNKLALADFRKAAAAAPTNKDIQQRIRECERRLREEAFAAAIDSSQDSPTSLCRNVDVSGIDVEATYDGPRIEASHPEERGRIQAGDGSITSSFCEQLISHFRAQKRLHRKYLLQIITAAYDLLRTYPNIVKIKLEAERKDMGPVAQETLTARYENGTTETGSGAGDSQLLTAPPLQVLPQIVVCGDTHGQFFDLARIFELNGLPSAKNPYLFNGDFVDRGSWSVEVITTLLAYMVYDPRCMHLVRGNHESRNMNKIYGFEGEVRHKYSEYVFELFEELFQALPLGYLIEGFDNKRALVVHGGLFSRDGVKLDEILRLDRFVEPPSSGLLAELLWSDPQKENGWGMSKRGVGASFGPDVTHRFLDDNHLALLIRSHEMKEDGYEIEADGRLITIFSAPNYCDQMGNRGACIRLKPNMMPDIVPFDAAPHPAEVRPMMYASMGGGLFGLQ
jgi:serine/threonine-protein phosphatase 5